MPTEHLGDGDRNEQTPDVTSEATFNPIARQIHEYNRSDKSYQIIARVAFLANSIDQQNPRTNKIYTGKLQSTH